MAEKWKRLTDHDADPATDDIYLLLAGDTHTIVTIDDLISGRIFRITGNEDLVLIDPLRVTEENTEFFFAAVLTVRDDLNRLEKYETFFGFDDADKVTQAASEAWSLVSVRFTDLPTGGTLVLRPHDKVWDNGVIDRVSVDRDDADRPVTKSEEILLADLDRLVFIPDEGYFGTLTLHYQVFDGEAWSGAENGDGSSLFAILVNPVNDAPELVTENPAPIRLYERDEDFGLAVSDDNLDGAGLPQALTEYALRTAHFVTVLPTSSDRAVIFYDAATLTAEGGRLELFDEGRREWAAITSGQFTVGALRDGHVRLRYDVVHNPDEALDFVQILSWGASDGTYDLTAAIRPPHILVLSNDDFGTVSDPDKRHDSHDLTLTVTLPRDAEDGTIQVWDGTVWATPADADTTTAGHQAEFTLKQLEDGHVRFVHGGGESGRVTMDWSVRDNGPDLTDGTEDDLSSGPYQLIVEVAPVNDRPTGGDSRVTGKEDSPQQIIVSDIPFADADGDHLDAVKITGITFGEGRSGRLTLNGRVVNEGDFIDRAHLDSLTFTPDADLWDAVTVTLPDGMVLQRYEGPQADILGPNTHLWMDINDEATNTVTLSWNDLMALRVKPSYATVTLDNLGTYFTQAGTTTDVDQTWLQGQSGHPTTGLVKVTAKNDAYVEVFINGRWTFFGDAGVDGYITAPDTSAPAAGIQAVISHKLVADGHVRIVTDRKILTFADLQAQQGTWDQLVFTHRGAALTLDFSVYDPDAVSGGSLTLADLQDKNNDGDPDGSGIGNVSWVYNKNQDHLGASFDFNTLDSNNPPSPQFRANALDITFTLNGVTRTVSLQAILNQKVSALTPDQIGVNWRVHADDPVETLKLSDILAGSVSWNPAVRSTADGRAELDTAVGTPVIGLITVPDGAVYQTYDPATNAWITLTDDADPDQDGQQVNVDLAAFITRMARFVRSPEDTGVPADAFVTVSYRVFDGTDLSSVEQDIRIHVAAVNDAPTAGDVSVSTAPGDVNPAETDPADPAHAARQVILEDTAWFFASVLKSRTNDAAARAMLFAAFLGFADVDAASRGAGEGWGLSAIRFTGLPDGSAGVLVLRPHDEVWDGPGDGAGLVGTAARSDNDVIVAVGQEIAVADLDRLVFIPAEDVNGRVHLRFEVSDGIDWSEQDYTLAVDITPVEDDPVTGGIQRDEVRGTNEADTLIGSNTADEMWGYGGADEIFAGAGDDILHGGAGADILHGGDGIDTASYEEAADGSGVTVDLEDTRVTQVVITRARLIDWTTDTTEITDFAAHQVRIHIPTSIDVDAWALEKWNAADERWTVVEADLSFGDTIDVGTFAEINALPADDPFLRFVPVAAGPGYILADDGNIYSTASTSMPLHIFFGGGHFSWSVFDTADTMTVVDFGLVTAQQADVTITTSRPPRNKVVRLRVMSLPALKMSLAHLTATICPAPVRQTRLTAGRAMIRF